MMNSYYEYLVDIPLGRFTKSELFWSVQNQIILAEENQRREDGSVYQDWRLDCICTYDHDVSDHLTEEFIVLKMALVDIDSADIWIPRRKLFDLDLPDALRMIAAEMNEINVDYDDVPQYCVYSDISVRVPNSFDDMKKTLQPNGVFSWLR